jgi:hypothetical protein
VNSEIMRAKKEADIQKGIVTIDNSLKKYKDMPLFQDKVDKANEMLRTVGLPKNIKKP